MAIFLLRPRRPGTGTGVMVVDDTIDVGVEFEGRLMMRSSGGAKSEHSDIGVGVSRTGVAVSGVP